MSQVASYSNGFRRTSPPSLPSSGHLASQSQLGSSLCPLQRNRSISCFLSCEPLTYSNRLAQFDRSARLTTRGDDRLQSYAIPGRVVQQPEESLTTRETDPSARLRAFLRMRVVHAEKARDRTRRSERTARGCVKPTDVPELARMSGGKRTTALSHATDPAVPQQARCLSVTMLAFAPPGFRRTNNTWQPRPRRLGPRCEYPSMRSSFHVATIEAVFHAGRGPARFETSPAAASARLRAT